MSDNVRLNDNALKTAHEMKLLEDLKDKLDSSLNALSSNDDIDVKEKTRLRAEAYKLLDMAQKSLLRRQIVMRIHNLEKEHVLLNALNERYFELSRLSADFSSRRGPSPNHKYNYGPSTYGRPKTGDDLYEELKRVREQIYRTIASENEEENKK